MNALDKALCRAHEIFLDDPSESLDSELAEILPLVTEAGYVEEWGGSSTGFYWKFTTLGIARGEELGCL